MGISSAADWRTHVVHCRWNRVPRCIIGSCTWRRLWSRWSAVVTGFVFFWCSPYRRRSLQSTGRSSDDVLPKVHDVRLYTRIFYELKMVFSLSGLSKCYIEHTRRRLRCLNAIILMLTVNKLHLLSSIRVHSLNFSFIYPISVLWHCWLGDRKGIRPVKSWVLVCWWWRFAWSSAHLIAPVVTTTSIILSSNKIQNRHSGTC